VRDGPFMAAADTFTVVVRGRGGHAAMPHQAADPVPAAAQVVTALQQIVSREVDPLEAAVVSVTRIAGGSADNIIPEAVEFGGTVRTFTAEVRARIIESIERVARGVAAANGCTADFSYDEGHAAVVNDADVAARVRACVPPERLIETPP